MSAQRLFPFFVMISLLAVTGIAARSGDDDGSEFKARLTGAEEVPVAVVTNTTARAEFEVNSDQTRIKFELKIRDATDILAVAGAHIHCAPKGVNGPIAAFLAGAVAGGFDGKVEIEATLSGANVIASAGCGSTIAELVQSMRDGNAYVNIHSTAHPGGEARGQIVGDD